MAPHVFAVSPDPDRLAHVRQLLEQAGADVDAHTLDRALALPVLPSRLGFFAWDGDRAALRSLLDHLPKDAHLACLVPSASLGDLVEMLADARSNHVIVGQADGDVLVTARKLLSGDIFGIEKHLPEGTEVHLTRLRDFAGRGAAIDTILQFAESSGMRRQVRSAIGQVCEELLMNALYDAPVDEEGRQIFAEVNPHARVEAQSPRPVSVRYAATPGQFAVAVRDRFGRLAKNTILAYITKCLGSTQQIDRKTYGAGLGLYLVANAAAGYVVNVAPGIATEVVCLFDRGPRTPLRQVGVFVHPGADVVAA